jgi:haloacid dehalogenase-like hydrolase
MMTRQLQKVTREGGPGYVAPAERIAVFDNDGTLWSEQPMYFQAFFVFDRIKALAPAHPEWREKEPFASVLEGDVKAALAGGEHALVEMVMATHAGTTTEEFERIVTDWIATAKHPKDGAALHGDGLPADARAARLPARERLQDLRRLRGRHRVHAPLGGEGLRHPAGAGDRQQHPDEARGPRRQAGAGAPPGDRLRGRRGRQASRDPDAHRPAADRGVRELRRRPADAAVDGRRLGEPVRTLRPPHRRRARVGLRPSVVGRPPRQGPRRSPGEGLDGRGHEVRLEARLARLRGVRTSPDRRHRRPPTSPSRAAT